MDSTKLKQALVSVPSGALEAKVCTLFINPYLINALGFSLMETVPQFKTSNTGNCNVDYAVRKNVERTIAGNVTSFRLIVESCRDGKGNNRCNELVSHLINPELIKQTK